MMSRVLKRPLSTAALRGGAGVCCLLTLAAAIYGAAAASRPGKGGWGAKLETEAEFAYRSVYERSLDAPRPMTILPETTQAAAKPAPALPERNPAAPPESEIVIIDTPPQPSVPPAPAPAPVDGAPAIAADPLGAQLIARPRGLYDVITTQVATPEANNSGAQAQQAVPRGPGDQYCTNIATAAADARYAWQRQTLLETEKLVEDRLNELNGKIAEYQKWLARRDDFSSKAQAAVTNIYAKMRPDAAAQQLMALDEETAAAVISQLNPRVSSALMAEMDAKQAARLTAIITASGKGPKGKPPAKPQGGGT